MKTQPAQKETLAQDMVTIGEPFEAKIQKLAMKNNDMFQGYLIQEEEHPHKAQNLA